MNYSSIITKESQLPGVRFRFRRLTEGVRLRIRMQLAETLAKLREIEAEREELFERISARLNRSAEEITVAELTPRERAEMDMLADRIELLNEAYVRPAYVEACLLEVEGLEIDGQAVTPENLRECGPPELYREIAGAIMSEAGLTDAERGNSVSPSTLPAVEGGQTQDINAGDAGVTGST
jgi:hypothetical protein